jgi:hypothetical protein
MMLSLAELGLAVDIRRMPCEIPDAVAFNEDHAPRAYDADVARAYWRAMLQVQRVFLLFRSRFVGKCSPIHLFWGSFDLAVTRFSGRDAPPHPGGMPHVPNAVAREAYCREVSSAGFWPGIDRPAFYSYAYPAPDGFGVAKVKPESAIFDTRLGEFLLPYEAVRSSADPDAALLPSCRARTRPPLILPIGSGRAWSERKASLVNCPRTPDQLRFGRLAVMKRASAAPISSGQSS